MDLKFIELIAKELEVGKDKILPETKLDEDIGWDSMDAISIMSAIDDEYNIQLDEEEFSKIITIKDIYDLVKMRNS